MSFPFYLERREDSEATSEDPTSTDKTSTVSNGTNNGNSSPAMESPAASVTSQPSNKRLNDGEVAGVAISCLVAGLIIGAIIAWQWQAFRAKGRSRHHRRSRRSEEGFRFMNHPRSATSVSMDPCPKMMKLENLVLQPAPDKDILANLDRLEDIIGQHVDALYHSDLLSVKVTTLARALSALGISEDFSGFHAETVAGWCLKPATRSGALKHVISHVLFRAIDWNSPRPLTLLPQPAVSFATSIRPVSENKNNSDVMSFAWTRWRTLSALFMHPAPEERTPLELSETDIKDQAEKVAEALDSVLCFFVAADQESQRKQRSHLRVLIVETAKLGYVLFSHTSEWRFIYQDASGAGRPVTCVGLDKLSGWDGHPLSSPQRLAKPRLLS